MSKINLRLTPHIYAFRNSCQREVFTKEITNVISTNVIAKSTVARIFIDIFLM